MEQVNLGSLPDGTGGDSIRVGFQKCNDNFTEVAEKLKTAGVASAEELKQIKDAATALAERVEKLEKASGGGVPADELATLKQQLQQLQTKLTAAVQAAGEAAGQAEAAAHAAGAAQQAASGAAQTANAAKQEAAAAKQTADGKAPASHTHTHNQISDWDSALTQTIAQALAAAMPAVKSETGYMKLPNGLIIQWGLASDNGDPKNFPIAFPNKALVLVGSAKWGAASNETSINAKILDNARFTMINGSGYDNDTSPNYWIAIGY
jgi:probable tail fiber protein (fragment)|nr:MAG TPA: putative tail fiber protein [Caudoviricetes sp.]